VEELTGVSFGNFINLANKTDDHDEIYAEMASGTRTKYEGESQYINKTGEVYWYQITISPIKKPTGDKSWLAVATMEDITEKKKVQEALSRTERLTMAGRLGASLAHEINNPLQSVIGCLGLAEEMLADGDEVKHYLDIAMQELERTADIVSQLRDMSRVPGVLSKKPVDVNALIEKALLLTRKRCQTQSIMVKWEPDDGLHQIPLAADRIQQVLLNLILNAVEAMEGGGQLEISTARTSEPDGVCIRIADNGIGIEPNSFPTLFEPFNSNRTEGLGLGLFISRRIINDEHGGHIDVESRPGEGTAFNIHLPG
jgi:two-component system sensor histidine kinase HydH